jgi:uncharacterized membrane protein
MTFLILGVALWSAAHFIPVGATGLRGNLVSNIGEGPYKGLFSLTLIGSVVLMVLGWRSITPNLVYDPPAFGAIIMAPLMLFAFALLGAANYKTNIKRLIRNPMLTGVVVWSVAHLATNGDDRSIALFGGMGLWALIMILLGNKRDGAYEKPEALPFKAEVKGFLITLVVFVVIILLHPYFAGVSPRLG